MIVRRLALTSALLLSACGATPPPAAHAPEAAPATDSARSDAPPARQPKVTVLARGQGTVNALAADATHAYWDRVTGEILRAPLQGGATEVVAMLPGEVMALAVGKDALALAVARGKGAKPQDWGKGTILRLPKTPDARPELVADDVLLPSAIAMTEDEIYWIALDVKGGQRLFTAPLVSGATRAPSAKLESEARGFVDGLTVVGRRPFVLWSVGGVEALALGADAPKRTYAVWGAKGFALADGKVLIVGDDGPASGGRTVLKAFPEAGGDGAVIASGFVNPQRLGVAKGAAYMTLGGTKDHRYQDGSVIAVPVAGGAITTVASAQWQPRHIAVSARNVVWVNERGHLVGQDGDAEIVTLSLP